MDTVSMTRFRLLAGGQSAHFWLATILVLATILRLFGFVGLTGADDVSVSAAAEQILQQGFFLPNSHYSARIGITIPLSVIYLLFGIGEAQLVALPFIASLIGIYLSYKIGKQIAGENVGLLAAALLTIFPLDVRFASILIPDGILGTLCAAAFYCAMRSSTSQRWAVWAIAGGMLWGWAYLVKVEAAFLAFPLALLLVKNPKSVKAAILFLIATTIIFVAENILYMTMGANFLHRMGLAAAQAGTLSVNNEYSETQLWVFPKSWFLTVYYFGFHYYILFFALLYSVIKRKFDFSLFAIWVIVFLLWLQFGGNPFSESYSFKSHLQRYCLMINVPVVVLCALFINEIKEIIRINLRALTGLVFSSVSLFLIMFNILSSERELAAKQMIKYAVNNDFMPLYLDKGSYDIATFLYKSELRDGSVILYNMQSHNFETGSTNVMDPSKVDGYVGVTYGIMEYRYNRYYIDPIKMEYVEQNVLKRFENPAPITSYMAARFISGVAGMIPIGFANRIAAQADGILQTNDAIISMGGLLKDSKGDSLEKDL